MMTLSCAPALQPHPAGDNRRWRELYVRRTDQAVVGGVIWAPWNHGGLAYHRGYDAYGMSRDWRRDHDIIYITLDQEERAIRSYSTELATPPYFAAERAAALEAATCWLARAYAPLGLPVRGWSDLRE